MDGKDADRSGLSQALGAGDAKPAQPPSAAKSEVCWTAVITSDFSLKILFIIIFLTFLLCSYGFLRTI